MQNDILRFSPSGGSGIKLSLILECEKKYYWKHVEGWREAKTGKNLAFGILLHQTFQFRNFTPFKTQWRRGTLEAADEGSEGKIIDRDEGDIEADIQLAERMHNRLMAEEIDVLEHETYLHATPVDPDTGDTPGNMERFEICGTRDMLERYDGRLIMSDLKTSRNRWKPEDALGSQQMQTYRYVEACGGYDVQNEGSFLVITKHKKEPILDRFEIEMNDDDHFAVFNMLRQTADAICRCEKTNEYRMNTASCIGAYGLLCPYHPLCFPHRYSSPEAEINEHLICLR